MGLEGKADTDTSKGTYDLPLFLATYSTITPRSSAVGPFAELASTEDLLRNRSTSLYKLQPFCKSIEAITHNINIHRLESMNCLNSDYPLWSTCRCSECDRSTKSKNVDNVIGSKRFRIYRRYIRYQQERERHDLEESEGRIHQDFTSEIKPKKILWGGYYHFSKIFSSSASTKRS